MPSGHIVDSLFFGDQYSTAEMREIFSDRAMLQGWLDAEAALAEAEAAVGMVPPEAAAAIRRAARADRIDFDAVRAGIDRTFHPIVPMVRELSRGADDEFPGAGRFVHWGATTQDIMDTGAMLQVARAVEIVRVAAARIDTTLARLAASHADTPMAGRTHGQHALPITFGFKVAIWLAEWRRHEERLTASLPRVLVGQLAGAVGTLAGFGPRAREVHRRYCAVLGLGRPPIAWHTARDGLAEMAFCLGLYGATCGKIAREVILLQKTEVAEVEEPWNEGKVGSSTMPHKRNPMICELIDGLSRLTRGEVTTALNGMVGEHERDMGAWQAEWEWLPRLFHLTSAALHYTGRVLDGLVVYPDRMRRNLDLTGGSILSEAVMLRLAEHLGRQEAHEVVYEVAMHAHATGQRFADALAADPRVCAVLDGAAIAGLLDPAAYLGEAAWFARAVAQADA